MSQKSDGVYEYNENLEGWLFKKSRGSDLVDPEGVLPASRTSFSSSSTSHLPQMMMIRNEQEMVQQQKEVIPISIPDASLSDPNFGPIRLQSKDLIDSGREDSSSCNEQYYSDEEDFLDNIITPKQEKNIHKCVFLTVSLLLLLAALVGTTSYVQARKISKTDITVPNQATQMYNGRQVVMYIPRATVNGAELLEAQQQMRLNYTTVEYSDPNGEPQWIDVGIDFMQVVSEESGYVRYSHLFHYFDTGDGLGHQTYEVECLANQYFCRVFAEYNLEGNMQQSQWQGQFYNNNSTMPPDDEQQQQQDYTDHTSVPDYYWFNYSYVFAPPDTPSPTAAPPTTPSPTPGPTPAPTTHQPSIWFETTPPQGTATSVRKSLGYFNWINEVAEYVQTRNANRQQK